MGLAGVMVSVLGWRTKIQDQGVGQNMSARDPMTRRVDAGGLAMKIVEQGEGPVVLLCHGFPETAHAWRHQLPGLAAAGYRAVAPDLRGHGGTDAPADVAVYSLVDLVGDLVGLLDTLGEDQAVLVGNDWGATLAWQASLMRPDRFRALVAIGVPMMDRAPLRPTELFPRNEEALHYLLYFQEPGIAEREFEQDPRSTLRKVLCAAAGEATRNPFGMVNRSVGMLAPLPWPEALPSWLTEADLDEFARGFERSGFRGPLNWYRNLDRNWELSRAFEGLKVVVPAVFMVGEHDPGLQIPGMSEILANMGRLVPDLRGSRVVQGSGHWLPQERPDAVNEALLAFLGVLPPSR